MSEIDKTTLERIRDAAIMDAFMGAQTDFFELPKERAKAFVGQLRAFYTAGWTAVFDA